MSIRKRGSSYLPMGLWTRISRVHLYAGLSACALLISLLGASQIAQAGTQTAPQAKIGGVTGLPLPRFASLKASRVNLRKGPGTKFPISWVFRHAGLPVEIVDEYQAWRRVRDSEGTTGWVLRTLLSGRRTAQITPWDTTATNQRPRVSVHQRPLENSPAVALVESGVVTDVQSCDGQWCFVKVSKYNGYLRQNKLWGVYKNESIR